MSDNKATLKVFYAHTKGLIENLPYEHIEDTGSERQGYINGFRAGARFAFAAGLNEEKKACRAVIQK